MSNIVDEIIKGRKTFFIAPDRTLFPQSYLEEYLTLGYECYFIDTDIFLPIEVKVDIILSVFKDSILFFNIDAPIQGNTWNHLIKGMQDKYPNALFGVLYAKRQSVSERQALERQYLYSIGIQCGCIQIEYQKKNNFQLIEQVLYANQAMGRRKNVRVPTVVLSSLQQKDRALFRVVLQISVFHTFLLYCQKVNWNLLITKRFPTLRLQFMDLDSVLMRFCI